MVPETLSSGRSVAWLIVTVIRLGPESKLQLTVAGADAGTSAHAAKIAARPPDSLRISAI